MKTFLIPFFIYFTTSLYGQNYNVYVSDAGNFANPPWQILKFDSAGQNPEVYISTNLNWPQDILFLEATAEVIVSNLGTGNIARYNSATGIYLSDFATGIGGPTRMKIGPDSLLYVLQWTGNGLVRKYNLDGTFAGNFTSVSVPQSIGLDWDLNGNLYVSSYSGDNVRKFDSLGNDMGLFVNSNLVGPTNIWFDQNGDLLVLDYDGNSVKRFDSTGAYIGIFIQGIGQAEGIAFLPNGNILIGSGSAHSVKMYDNAGNYFQDFISPGSGNLITPNAIVGRELANVSVFENKIPSTSFVHPTTGRVFYFDDRIKTAAIVQLFSVEGKFIQDIPIQKSWRAENLNEGYYLITIRFENGTDISQKIIIN